MVIAATRDTLIAAVFLYLLCIRFGDERTDATTTTSANRARYFDANVYKTGKTVDLVINAPPSPPPPWHVEDDWECIPLRGT